MAEEICRDIYRSDSEWRIILLRYFNPVGAHPSGYLGEDPRGVPNNLMPYVQQVAVGRRPSVTIFGNNYATKDGTGVFFFTCYSQSASTSPLNFKFGETILVHSVHVPSTTRHYLVTM